jgi:electron transport complex protein RnfB
MSLVQDIEKVLPQTQCQSCGYAGCRPYAQALVSGEAKINQCPPGGVETLKALGKLLKIDPKDYLADMEKSLRPPQAAVIQKEACIGCTKCIQACPVDAIIGSSKKMHHIISWECTGCGLCVEPCPVDCIEMIDIEKPVYDKDKAKLRYEARQMRQEQLAREKQKQYLEKSRPALDQSATKIDYIQEALKRVQNKKNSHE